MKREREIKKNRVYEIYGIPKEERHKHQMHHIVFKSDKKKPPFEDFDIDKKANFCPLSPGDHQDLHDKVRDME